MSRARHRPLNLSHSSMGLKGLADAITGFPRIPTGSGRVIRSGREDRSGWSCRTQNASRRGQGTAAAWENPNDSTDGGGGLLDRQA
jgi:hypothetical protein